jgi:hypothetical protein
VFSWIEDDPAQFSLEPLRQHRAAVLEGLDRRFTKDGRNGCPALLRDVIHGLDDGRRLPCRQTVVFVTVAAMRCACRFRSALAGAHA